MIDSNTPVMTIKNGKLSKIENKRLLIENLATKLSHSSYIVILDNEIDIKTKDIKSFYIGKHDANHVTIQDFRTVNSFTLAGERLFSCKQHPHPKNAKRKLLKVTFKM
ncbi:hypothetical protein N356_gp010 [Cellulophaga phage phi14:2]|uniref:Uncharacterized protein n=1 Tax=Cellulophaga phage phi14:2 TaxID=1327990 RepID=S0A271_9CAUD|nr:hypothetical protein N356_gp010 [Cellulophaga phage phi14:2]AGO48900.1 hypothetical protein Phi14:2_gp022 [Cellulophaga phage phi14:2]